MSFGRMQRRELHEPRLFFLGVFVAALADLLLQVLPF